MELIKIDDEQFGKLIELPSLYEKNLAIANKAKLYIDQQLKVFDDFIGSSDVFSQGWIEPIQKMRALCVTRLKEFEEERKPYTAKMDAIKSLFTSLEKIFKDAETECKKRESEFERRKVEYNTAREKEIQAAPIEDIFEVAAATPIAVAAKGLTVKQKYAPTTHAHFTLIMRAWVAKEMALLTPAELDKKLSFMITAANLRLNKSEVIEGVPTVNDFITKVQR
jgi:hypothetical protein